MDGENDAGDVLQCLQADPTRVRESLVTTEATLNRILKEASKHQSLIEREAENELLQLLDRAWAEAGLGSNVPVRGRRGDFWRRLGQSLSTRASSEAESVSVLMGMVAHDVLQWASEKGIPAEKYEYFVGLLVAWTTLAALKQSKSGPKKN
jgi:hypothetical protein